MSPAKPRNPRRCTGKNKRGERCSREATEGDRCYAHKVGKGTNAADWAGFSAPTTPAEARDLLAALAIATCRGEIEPKITNAVTINLNTLLKYYQVTDLQAEWDSLKADIATIREAAGKAA